METRANYVLIGAFTLAAIVGAFLFVMWIAGYGTAGGHRSYQVVFNGSVAGLSTGANVSFNGIKVGEVTHLTFSRSDPHQVVADIDINSEAPIDRNTKARLETQGLTGGAVVALLGGLTAGAALVAENGRPPKRATTAPPVSPCVSRRALVFLSIGASALTSMSATTWCGSLREKVRCVTSPTLIPLNETLAPVERPATEPLKTT